MMQGTTPPYVLTVPGRDLRDKTVFVTLQGMDHNQVTKTGDDLTIAYSDNDTTIAFRLTQEETFALKVGEVEVQVRFVGADGIADGTDIVKLKNLRVLLQKIIRYGEGG